MVFHKLNSSSNIQNGHQYIVGSELSKTARAAAAARIRTCRKAKPTFSLSSSSSSSVRSRLSCMHLVWFLEVHTYLLHVCLVSSSSTRFPLCKISWKPEKMTEKVEKIFYTKRACSWKHNIEHSSCVIRMRGNQPDLSACAVHGYRGVRS